MSASNRAEYSAYLDFKQVDQGLETTAKKSEGAVLSYGKLEAAMTRTEMSGKRLGGYLQQQFVPQFAKLEDAQTRTTKGFWSLEGGAKAFQQRLAPQAAAISGITSALGENAGQTGKAVAGLGQLAAAYAAGGPWGVILAAAGVGATMLVKYWDDVIAKQDEALGKAYSGVDAAAKLRDKAKADIASLKGDTLNPVQAAYAKGQAEIDAANRRLADAKATFAKNVIDESKLSAALSPAKRAEIVEANDEMKKRYGVEISLIQEAIGLLETKQGLEAARASKGTATKTATAASTKSGGGGPDLALYDGTYAMDPSIADNTAILNSLRAPAFNKADREDEEFERKFRIQADYASRVDELNRWAADQAILHHQRVGDSMDDLYSNSLRGSLGAATGVLNQFFVAQASGQEHAAAKGLAAGLTQIGGILVAEGTAALWKGGIANAEIPGSGIALMLAGGGAVAAGFAMGAGGAAISASIPSGAGGAGGRGATERGSSGGGFGSGGGGRTSDAGAVHLHVHYGVSGPAPEQIGRKLVEASSTLARRQGNAPAMRQGPRARL